MCRDDHDIKLERFMTDMQRYLITIKKDEFPDKCIQNMKKHFDISDQDSDGETWAPPRPTSTPWTWSSASSARTTSSPMFDNVDNDGDDDNNDDKSSSLSLHSLVSSTDDDVQDDEHRNIIFDASTDDNKDDDDDRHHPSTSTPKTPKTPHYHFQDDDENDVTLIEDRPKPKKSRKTKSKLTSVKKALSRKNSVAELFEHGSPKLRSPGNARQHLDSQSELSTVESTRRKLTLKTKK